MAYPAFMHDPEAILDYEWDLSEWLAEGDTIVTATVTVANVNADDDAAVNVDSVSNTTTTVTAWVSGGSLSFSPYILTCHYTTVGGREDDRSIQLKIKER